MKIFFNRAGKIAAPFPPRTWIVSHLSIPGKLQHKIQPRRPDAARAVAYDIVIRLQSFIFQGGPDRSKILNGRVRVQKSVPRYMNRGGNMSRPRNARDFLPQVLLKTSGIENLRAGLSMLEQRTQLVLRDDGVAGRHDRKITWFWRHTSMLKRPLLRDPFDPAAVKNAHLRVAEIFEHPVHPPFVSPIIEGIGVDDDLAVLI